MKKLLEGTITALALVILVASVVGFILDRPVLVSYAYSESMTPTINKGDLFFINPLSKNVDVGDVIVFHRRDGWTVHRVYAVTAGGYITKGDHNVATDQEGGIYLPVKSEDIAGKVVSFGGNPLVIRGGGNFVSSLRGRIGNNYLIVGFLVVGTLLLFSGGEKKRKHRGKRYLKFRMKPLYALASVGIILAFTFVVFASWGTMSFTYSSTLAGGQREGWYLPGSYFERNLTVENRAVYPFHYFVEPKDGGTVLLSSPEFDIPGKSSHTVLLGVNVPAETRVYRDELEVYSYPRILPLVIIRWAYGVSPYFPLFLYSLELSAVLFLVYVLSDIGNEAVLRIRVRRGSLLAKISGDD